MFLTNCALQIPFAQLLRCVFLTSACTTSNFLARCLRKNRLEGAEQSILSDVLNAADEDASIKERTDVDED
jgi:hypothetical protein